MLRGPFGSCEMTTTTTATTTASASTSTSTSSNSPSQQMGPGGATMYVCMYIYIYISDIQCMYIYTLHIAHSVSCFQLSVHLMHINLNLRPTNRTLLASKAQSNVVAPLFLVRPRTLTMSVKCRPETGTTKIRGVPSKWDPKSMVKW